MPKSMTGFGRGHVSVGAVRYVVEAKSVNSRFCEIRFQAPKEFLHLEHTLSQLIREKFERGKFDVLLSTEVHRKNHAPWDQKEIVTRWKKLDQLRKKMGILQQVRFETAFFDVQSSKSEARDPSVEKHFVKATKQALENVEKFRAIEGNNLAKDIRKRLHVLNRNLTQIELRAKGVVRDRLKKMQERVEVLLQGRPLESSRIDQEMAALADRSDVTEEIVRLKSHFENFEGRLNRDEKVGRPLDFLLQEIFREVNTIGSKVSDVNVTEAVVGMKSEIEKIREQVQNIE